MYDENIETTTSNSTTPLLGLDNVRVRFYLKIRKCTNTCNGNGHGSYQLDWAFYKKRGHKVLYRFTIGSGDTGNRCQ